eukprot:g17364.t1
MVITRCRPFNQREKDMDSKLVVHMPDDAIDGRHVVVTDETGQERTFEFDRAYWSHDETTHRFVSQEDVMQDVGKLMLDTCYKGLNVSMFAYGQTGAGKSFSVIGAGGELRGLLPRMLEDIYESYDLSIRCCGKDKGPGFSFETKVSFIEIYNEMVHDLLDPKMATVKDYEPPKMEVKQHPKLGIFIPGLTEVPTKSADECFAMMDRGLGNRAVASTKMNAVSSRSHCVFMLELDQNFGNGQNASARINLVDLAGSERQKKTGVSGDRMKEATNINKSLTCLAMVIAELAKGNTKTAPFRNSKLTFILKDALSGNSRTIMLTALSPAEDNASETVSTLHFAKSVKMIKTSAKANVSTSDARAAALAEIAELKKELAEQQHAMAQMQQMLDSGGGGAPSMPGGAPLGAAGSLLPHGIQQTFPASEFIYKKGEIGHTMFLVLAGKVERLNEQTEVVATLEETALFGEAAALGLTFLRTHSHRVSGDGPCTLLVFSPQMLHDSFLKVSNLRYALIEQKGIAYTANVAKKQLWDQEVGRRKMRSAAVGGERGVGVSAAVTKNADARPFLSIVHPDEGLSNQLVYQFTRPGEMITIGSAPDCDVRVCGPFCEPVICRILNYDDVHVYIAGTQPTPEARAQLEQQTLHAEAHDACDTECALAPLDQFLSNLRGPSTAAAELGGCSVILEDGKTLLHEQENCLHAFSAVENCFLLNTEFYFRCSIPKQSMMNEGSSDVNLEEVLAESGDMDLSLGADAKRDNAANVRAGDVEFFQKTALAYTGLRGNVKKSRVEQEDSFPASGGGASSGKEMRIKSVVESLQELHESRVLHPPWKQHRINDLHLWLRGVEQRDKFGKDVTARVAHDFVEAQEVAALAADEYAILRKFFLDAIENISDARKGNFGQLGAKLRIGWGSLRVGIGMATGNFFYRYFENLLRGS